MFRDLALGLVEQLAGRYGEHPALAMWHVSNELGCHNLRCYCDVSAAAFRRWLINHYGDLDELNRAWGTAFWSQHYGDVAEIWPPRLVTATANPTQQLDFARFCSDELLDYYRAERDVLRRVTPDIPVTTNFMVMSQVSGMDYWSWAPEQDVVSNDHYLDDAAGFFQWRAGRAGSEKIHSALLPNAGTDTRVWREVVHLGQVLQRAADVAGTRVESQAAFLLDWNAWWATDLDSHPSELVRYADQPVATHRALWSQGITMDGTRLDDVALAGLLGHVAAQAGVRPAADVPAGVEVTLRHGDGRSFLFVMNHNDHEVTLRAQGTELIGGADCDGTLTIPGGGCALVRERG